MIKPVARRPKLSMPQKPKPWSHQDELLAMRGKRVVVYDRDGESTNVTLLEADQFAVKLASDDQSTVIVWKHDLASIRLA